MAPSETGAARIRRLRVEIAADRRALGQRDDELDSFLIGWGGPQAAQAAALALVLERAYTGVEALLERVVRVLDGDEARGRDWHRTLLELARLDVPKVRPAILGRAASAADELRRFRHFVRHAYAAPLDAERVRELATAWQSARPLVEEDLDDFDAFLDELARRLESD